MSAELTTVHLVGSLGKAMGRSEWHLDVKSPAEAIRAIDVNLRGKLREYLSGPARNKFYKIALQKKDNVIDRDEVVNRSGRSTIYIMPTINGRNSGVGKILTAIAIIALVAWNPLAGTMFATTATTAAGATTLTAFGAVMAGFGVSMLLGGMAQLLAPTPQGPSANPEQAQSTSFPGNAGAVVQGGCIPVVYGRALVSPIPVAVTTTNNDTSTSAAGTAGTVDKIILEGGGTQYNTQPE